MCDLFEVTDAAVCDILFGLEEVVYFVLRYIVLNVLSYEFLTLKYKLKPFYVKKSFKLNTVPFKE